MSCDRTKQTFEGIIDCVLSDTVDNFVSIFGNDPSMSCSQNNLITQQMNVVLDNVDTSKSPYPCTFNFSQNIDLTGKKVCLDINQKLASLSSPDRQNIISQAIDQSILNIPINIRYKTQFITLLKNILSSRLMNTSPSNNITTGQGSSVSNNTSLACSQKVQVRQEQNIKISGEINCKKDGGVDISQEAIVKAYMKCIIDPLTDTLKTNPELKDAFNYSPNADCLYDLIPQNACSNNIRTYKANILSPSRGTGSCPYGDGEIIEDSCSLDQCQVGEWKEVSLCENGKIKSIRKIIKNGLNCPQTIKYDNCSSNQTRTRPPTTATNTSQNINSIKSFIDTHQFLLFKPSLSTLQQKLIFILIILFFIITLVYILI